MWPYITIVVREEVVILKNRPTGGEASCVVSDSIPYNPLYVALFCKEWVDVLDKIMKDAV